MTTNIKPRNEQGLPHGYWEVYYDNGQLILKGNYVNGKREGYWEFYYFNGELKYKGNYVNGEEQGYFIEYCNKSYYKFYYKKSIKYYKNKRLIKNPLYF